MPVDTKHDDYQAAEDRWQRCRDCYDGTDAVKKGGTKYLPPLDSHKKGQASESLYRAYLQRALFYNATARTVDGLVGAVFQKDPDTNFSEAERPDNVPASLVDDMGDVDLAGTPMTLFAQDATTEVVTVGRYGVLLEMAGEESPENRPYWVGYRAEDIVNWRTERIGGDEILTRVVLRECEQEEDPKDPFATKEVEQYRVLELVVPEGGGDPVYEQSLWRKPKNGDKYQEVDRFRPMRRRRPLGFIPFVFLGPISVYADVARPPLLDLVDVNLSHYRNSADYEHGLHWTGVPMPWTAGLKAPDDGDVEWGPHSLLDLSEGGRAGIIQADGSLLGALENAMEAKEKKMATLGARLLESQPDVQQTATEVMVRHAGEHATLRSIAGSISRGLTKLVRWHAWWSDSSIADPMDVDATVELNRDFVAVEMTPDKLAKLVLAFQAGAIGFDTLYYNLQKGEIARPGVEAEQELEAIRQEGMGLMVGQEE